MWPFLTLAARWPGSTLSGLVHEGAANERGVEGGSGSGLDSSASPLLSAYVTGGSNTDNISRKSLSLSVSVFLSPVKCDGSDSEVHSDNVI